MILLTFSQSCFRVTLLILSLSTVFSITTFPQSVQLKPLGIGQIELLIKNQTPDSIIADEIRDRGIDFVVTEEFIRQISPKNIYPKTIAALKNKLRLPVLITSDSPSITRAIKILIADFYSISGEDRAIRQNIVDRLSQLVTETNAEIIIPRAKVESSNEARKLGEKEKADIVLWGWYAISDTTAQISANFEFISEIPFISDLKSQGAKQIPIKEIDNFSFQVKIGEEYSALVLLTLGLISEERDDLEQAIEYYTQALNLKGVSEEMSFHLLRQRGSVRFDLASLRGIILETQSLLDLKAALAIHPDDLVTHYVIGTINYERSNWSEAITDFNLALARCNDPEIRGKILLQLVKLFDDKGDETSSKQALESFSSESATIKNPYKRNLFLAVGHLLRESYTESRANSEAALKLADNKNDRALAYLLMASASGAESETVTDIAKEAILSTKAAFYLDLAIDMAPNNLLINQQYRLLKFEEGNYEKVIESVSIAITLRPKASYFYVTRGDAYKRLNNYQAAIKDFEKAVEIDPKSIYVRVAKSNFHKHRKEFRQAINELDICLSIEKRGEFYAYKADIYEESKDYQNARKEILQAVKLDPQYSGQYFEMIKEIQSAETNRISLQAVENLLVTEKSPYLLIEKSFIMLSNLKRDSGYQGSPSYKAVVNNFEQAISITETDTNYADSLHLQNICFVVEKKYYDENDSKNGIAILSKCLEKLTKLKIEDTQLAHLYSDRGSNYLNIGDNDAAIKDYSTAIKYDSKRAIYHRNRSVSYRAKQMFAESLNDIKNAISLDPTESDFYEVRALTYELMKDFKSAREDLLQMIFLKSEDHYSFHTYFLKTKQFRQNNSSYENLNLLNRISKEFNSPYSIIERGLIYIEAISEKIDSADENYKNAVAEFDKALAFTLSTSKFKKQNYIYGVCRVVTDKFTTLQDYDSGIRYANKCIKEIEVFKYNYGLIGDIYNQRGVLFYKSGNFDAAINDSTKALEKERTSMILQNRANAYYMKKMFAEALDDINLAIKEEDSNASYYFVRSNIYRDKGDFDKAIADIKIAIEREFNANQKAEYQKHLNELLIKAKLRQN